MDRGALVKTLELVGRALAGDALVPIFQCYCFEDGRVRAYNDKLGIAALCEVTETFALHGGSLLGLLSASQADEVTFKLEGQDALIKAGRSNFKLPYFPKENFLFDFPEESWVVTLRLTEDLMTGLDACLLTSSKDNTQPAIMGVTLKNEKKVTLYSCDGDAITRYITCEVGASSGTVYTMPNEFCAAVLKVWDEHQDDHGALQINKEWAKVIIHDYIIYGRMLANDNPLDHAAEIKNTVKGKLEFKPIPDGLDQALSRARVLADPESAKTLLSIAGGKMKLHTETQMGQVRDVLPLPGHPDVELNVSAEMVQRSINPCTEVAFRENCCCYREGETLFIVTANME